MNLDIHTYPYLVEETSNYAFTVKKTNRPLSFEKFRTISNKFYNDLPEHVRNELHESILHGTCKLSIEPALNAYMHDMGKMHNAKFRKAFANLSKDFYKADIIDVIDYGCGQGLGIISLADHLRETNSSKIVRRIVLIEPSEIALKRAALHASALFPSAELIATINKGFDKLTDSDITSDKDVMTLHIISNVLDLAKTQHDTKGFYDMDYFADTISANLKGQNQFVCIEPLFKYSIIDEKLDYFCNRVGVNSNYKLICDKGEFVSGTNWTCSIVCGTKNCVDIIDVLKQRYWIVGDFVEGMAIVGQTECPRGQKFGFVNTKGEEVIQRKYYSVTNFRNGIAFVCYFGYGWGAIDKQGQILVPIEYDTIEWKDDNCIVVKSANGDTNIYECFEGSCKLSKKSNAIKLYDQQQKALNSICNFLNSDNHVFILKGYAGTGKTTLIKALISKLEDFGKKFILMAPTGRAAKILRNKTGHNATTIHRQIYSVERLTSVRHDENGELIKMVDFFYKDKEEKRKHDTIEFWFGINTDHGDNYDPKQTVYIVDEASMVSSKETNNEIFHFGTDMLLDDLLEYTEVFKGGKIVFVGDPAQLPPVGDNKSVALSEEYFSNMGLNISSFELTDVIRQDKDSAILENAMMIRDLLASNQRNRLTFKRSPNEVEDVLPTTMISKYIESYPEPVFGNAPIICYSNNLAKGYNDSIRTYYYPGEKYVQIGDILQVVKNHYIINDTTSDIAELYNGDFVKVLEVSPQVETQSAPVWTKLGNHRETVSLTFRDVTIQSEDGNIYKMKIIDSLLNSSEPKLSPDEHTALYINFRMRNSNLPKDHEAAAKVLMGDPYYNALNVKYGYAITGHKSQGGDWDTVFVDYAGRTGLNNDSLRWMYTATTRAKKRLYGLNLPNIQPFDKLQVRTISQTSKPAANARCIVDLGNVEMLPLSATHSQKAKYLSIEAALSRIGFRVERVEQMPYKDRYHIRVVDGKIEKYDCIYNAAGFYTTYSPLQSSANSDLILNALHSEECYEYRFDYIPSEEVFAQLYAKMQSAADEVGAQITNVVEEIKQYYILYHLKTSGKFARIKFYFNANRFITYAQPESDLGNDDQLMKLLIKKIE